MQCHHIVFSTMKNKIFRSIFIFDNIKINIAMPCIVMLHAMISGLVFFFAFHQLLAVVLVLNVLFTCILYLF